MERDRHRSTFYNHIMLIGSHNNAWAAAATGVGGTSAKIDTKSLPHVSVFGNTSGASTITVQFSADNTNFYDSGTTVSANGDFGINFTGGAQYVRLKSSANVTVSATVSAKE